MQGFECIQRITYQGIKPDLAVSLPNLLSLVMEASLLHTESTPFPMSWYADNHFGFLLTNWQVRVSRYPKWNEIITIRTWPTYFKGVIAERSFDVTDAAGNPVLYANTSWVFTDLNRRRPVRPSEQLLNGYGELAPPLMEKNYKTPDYTHFELVRTKRFTSMRGDTDANSHVNNIVYLTWAVDLIPDDIYNRLDIVDMKCVYKKECARGDDILAEAFMNPNDRNAFIVLIKNSRQNTLLCEIYFRFDAMV